MGKRVARGGQNLFDARKLRGRLSGVSTGVGHEDMHRRAEGDGRGQGLGGGVVQLAAVNFRKEKSRHQSTPASFLSLPTSSATDPTFAPALRLAGSVVFSTVNRGATSTP